MHLLKHFKELTIRPKNAHELKDLILQLAVQGNLTSKWREENPDIENAKQIYQRINEERDALINKRKIKLRNINPIQETLDMRFNLPNTWEWFSFSDVVFYQEGPGIRTWQFRDTGVKLLNVQNIVGDTLVLDNTEKHVDKVEFEEKYRHFKVEPGDLLFASSGGSWGKSAWFKDPGYDVMMNTSMIRLKFYSKEWFPEYLKYFLSSIFFKKQLECQLVGIQPNFGSTHLGRSFIPIPPIEEQKAIVEVVEALFKEVEQLEHLTVERITLKEKFVASALNQLTSNSPKQEWAYLQEHFHSFFNETTNIKKLRETVLQLAVQGKLTSTWRVNHPELVSGSNSAKELLKRIQKEKAQLVEEKKIKKEKPLPPITKDEIPYELPQGWEWCRMQEVGLFERGKSKHRPRNDFRLFADGIYPLVQTGDVSSAKKNGGIIKTHKSAYNDFGLVQSKMWDKGTLCITIAANIAETGFLGYNACFPDSVVGFSSLSDDAVAQYVEYFVTVMKSDLEKYAPSTAQKNINLGILYELKFPLPPIKEQKAIVQKVNALMGLCDALEQEVQQSQEQSEKLMQSVLREVFLGKKEVETDVLL